VVAPAALRAQCSLNLFDCGGGPNVHPMTATATRVCGTYTMSYDLTTGELHTASPGNDTGAQDYGAISTNDRFQVNGVASGTPLTFAVEMTVQGDCGGNASLWVGLAPPAQVVCISTETVLRMPIQCIAGDFFGVNAYVMSQSTGEASACHARYRFTGLPEGASVVSCQGFRQDFPVPIRPFGWGDLKVRYR